MMGADVRCAIEAAAEPVTGAAAVCVRAFFPDVRVDVLPGYAVLSAPARRDEELVAIWSSAVANEALLAGQRAGRSRVIEMLLR